MNRFSAVLAAIFLAPFAATSSSAETLSYSYDSLGRLVGVVADRGPTATATSLYRYDAADNRNYVSVAKADGTKIPIFRFFKNPNRFYTTDYMEGSELGFDPEQLAFSLYPSSGSGLVGLYRCYASANAAYFITTASNCEGQTVQGLMGYAYTTAGTGRRALYRFYKASTADHLVTVSYDEGNNNGYTLVSTLGYVI